MSKTIEEILSPKPEARPRIYAYSIDDKAHAGLLKMGQTTRDVKQRVAASAAPTARPNTSPGQRPGLIRRPHQALKGRPNRRRHWVALSGLEWITATNPRALPWAGLIRPVGADCPPGTMTATMSKTIEEILSPKP